MNKQQKVKIQGRFDAEVVRILRQVPDIAVTVEPVGDPGVDAVFRFAGTSAPVAVEVKGRANAATAWQLVHLVEARPNAALLLVAGETTAEARQILASHGVGLIDGLGNAHVELPGLLLHLEGRGRPAREHRPGTPALRGKAGVAAQALLLHPDRSWQVQDLAREAAISTGLAHRLLTRLEHEGVVTSQGAGPRRVRRVADPTALLDLWAEEVSESPTRTLGYLLAQTPQRLMTDLAANLERAEIHYALTGAAGASLVAPFVTAIPVVDVWVTSTRLPDDLYDGAHADPVTDGHNVTFLQARDDTALAFRTRASGLWIANPLRLYADLRSDPRRGPEQADHLRREAIGF